MSVRTKVAKAVRLLSGHGVRLFKMSPRVPYLHYWTLRDDAESFVCLHNFFSILKPDARQPCGVFIRFYNANGRPLTSTSLEVEPRGSRMVDVRRAQGALLGTLGGSREGSLEVDVAPPGDFKSVLDEAVALQPSNAYFYMMYRSPRGRGNTSAAVPG